MSYTKYVMDADGHFVMISKYSGLDHQEVARLIDITNPVGAGFVTVMDGRLTAYSKSITLGLSSRDEDGDVMTSNLLSGDVSIVWHDQTDTYYATNLHTKSEEGIADLDLLLKERVISAL